MTAYEGDIYWSEFNIQGVSKIPQDIENVESLVGTQGTSKILRNGQILILRGDKVYTLQGQEVK